VSLESVVKTSLADGGWTRASAIDRSKDKLESVIRWLGWFDYSDRETIASMLGVSKDGQSAFFKRLEESGFLCSEKAPGIRKVIYSLGDAGFEYALMLLPEIDLKRRRRLPSWVSLVHTFSVQAAVIARLEKIESIKPEKTLKHLRAVRLPDAILKMNDGTTVALEVELNHKSSARVYNIFLSHLKNIRNNNYERVVYLFPNDSLCRLYREKYDQPRWPIYTAKAGSTRLVMNAQQSFDAEHVRGSGLFQFQTEDMYSL